MRQSKGLGELQLLLAALLWGISLVSQKLGMVHLGPFSFSAIRLLIGAGVLVPVYFLLHRLKLSTGDHRVLKPGILLGVLIFTALSFQQFGLLETSAGKAAFITTLYIVIVPVIGIFLKKKMQLSNWLGVLLGLVGLYLLSVQADFTVNRGDILLLIGALFWSGQILVIDRYSAHHDGVLLSMTQFLVAGSLFLLFSLWREQMTWDAVWLSRGPILFAGIIAVGVAYTLQIFGQRSVPPALASMIMSLEAVFAVFAGMIFLNERLSMREVIGCIVMFMAILLSQYRKKETR